VSAVRPGVRIGRPFLGVEFAGFLDQKADLFGRNRQFWHAPLLPGCSLCVARQRASPRDDPLREGAETSIFSPQETKAKGIKGKRRMRWNIGKVKITKIVELETVGSTRFILALASNEEIRKLPWLIPAFATDEGRLKMSIHSLVVETPTRLVVVDTGLGNDKQGRSVPA